MRFKSFIANARKKNGGNFSKGRKEDAMATQTIQLKEAEFKNFAAIVNMEQVLDAAHQREVQAYEKEIDGWKACLKESEANNKLLYERIRQLVKENASLKQQNQQLTQQVSHQKKAFEDREKEEKKRVKAGIVILEPDLKSIVDYFQEEASAPPVNVRGLTPPRGRIKREVQDTHQIKMKKYLKQGQAIQKQLQTL